MLVQTSTYYRLGLVFLVNKIIEVAPTSSKAKVKGKRKQKKGEKGKPKQPRFLRVPEFYYLRKAPQ